MGKDQPTSWNRVRLEKLAGAQIVKKFPARTEVEGSLLCLKEAATGFCPKSLTCHFPPCIFESFSYYPFIYT